MKNNPEIREAKFAMIHRWKESGLNQKQFIAQENIPFNTFYYWLKQYRKANAKEESLGFIKLPCPIKRPVTENCYAELTFTNGNRLRFFSVMEIAQLKQLAL